MLQEKSVKEKSEGLALRIKIGEYEVEVRGRQEEVIKTFENLPNLVSNVNKAFESVKPKTVATLTVKTEASKSTHEAPAQKYPRVPAAENCEEAVLRILETDWGKWRPRTMEELKEAMKANDLRYPIRLLETTLNELADKGRVKRWNTNTGFVYILAEGKSLSPRSDM